MPAEVEKKAKFHEPWAPVPGTSRATYAGGDVAFEALGENTRDRIVETVNACEGYENPMALREIVDALRKINTPAWPGSIHLLAKLDKPAEERKNDDASGR